MSAIRCPRHCCGLLMWPRTDGMGRVAFVCDGCARNKRGLCRDCPQPRANSRALRCVRCAKVRALTFDRVNDRARYAKRRAAVLAHHRAYQLDPEIREHRRLYMVAYRAANPRDGLDRAYMRAYQAKRRSDPHYRAQEAKRKRELRALKRAA